jgi:hypothetical protein
MIDLNDLPSDPSPTEFPYDFEINLRTHRSLDRAKPFSANSFSGQRAAEQIPRASPMTIEGESGIQAQLLGMTRYGGNGRILEQ